MWKSKIPRVVANTDKNLKALVRRAAFAIEGNAKILAPVDTGFLRNSIQTEVIDDLNAKVTVGAEYAVWVNFGTTRMPANPFFSQAVDTVIAGFGGQLKKVVEG